MKLKETSKQFLLHLSRHTLEEYFNNSKKPEIIESDISDPKITKKGATFVTLTIDGELRGCIGTLIPKNKIYKDVINNTLNAAFSDPRFPQLSKNELTRVKIEISILSEPKHVALGSPEEFLKELEKSKPGLIIQLGLNQATYLPQVWEDLPDPEEFMSSLCQKAGLSSEDWKRPDAEIFSYNVEHFLE
jgi:AmmeMemoRadiSam system protein A